MPPVDRLRSALENTPVLILAGAGVSASATGNAPCSTWSGLLESGVERCVENLHHLSADWEGRVRADLNSTDETDILAAASKISTKLKEIPGLYNAWLAETVGQLKPTHPRLLQALVSLGANAIATTNYDTVIERHSGLPPTNWRVATAMQRALRVGDAILHLHGHWQDPESVILDLMDYQKVSDDDFTKTLFRGALLLQTIIFVGFGAGIRDPNLGKTLRWARPLLAQSQFPHFRLVRESELQTARLTHPPEERIELVVYGAAFDDLAPFLEELARRRHDSGSGSAALRQLDTVLEADRVSVPFDSDTPAEVIVQGQASRSSALWAAGARRSAWTALATVFDRYSSAIDRSLRVQVGLTLAGMILEEGVPERAQRVLISIEADCLLSAEASIKAQFETLRRQTFTNLYAYDQAVATLRHALTSAPNPDEIGRLRAELGELLLLNGDLRAAGENDRS